MILWNRILVGIDAGDHSMEAVRYLAAVLGGSSNVKIHLLSVYQPPPVDDLTPKPMLSLSIQKRHAKLRGALSRAREILLEARFPLDNLSMDLMEAGGRTVGEALLDARKLGGFGTIVVGRRELTKQQEFLFGSVSSRLARAARGFCVWVVSS